MNLLYIYVKFSYICSVKKNTTLELIEQSDKVSLYSISFEMDHTTEFERFMHKFESEATLNEDLQLILENGVLERYFRPEGAAEDNLCALPIESGKIRLYCLRISDQILIIGNGGIKRTHTYQEDKSLYGYVLDLQKFDNLLRICVADGSICIEEKTIKGVDDKVFRI